MNITPTFEIFGITLHLYGLIIGISIIVATSLIEKQYKKLGYPEDCFWKIGLVALAFGVFGARAWHVATDSYLYVNNVQGIFYIWNGGLSILGGVLGGIFGIYFALRYFVDCKQIKMFELLDIAVFGLPVAQIIGRLGNYVNQELYGKPTDFVLKIFISQEYRLLGFENIVYYHPLFLYEMIAMTIFTVVLYYRNSKKKLPKIGSGKIFFIYTLYYSIIRFLLEFIRLEKAMFMNSFLSINQVVLLLIIVITSYYLFIYKKNTEQKINRGQN